MYTLTQICEKLYALPEAFRKHCEEGRWCVACADYEDAVVISRFIQMDDEPRMRLLGQFEETAVQQAFKQAGRWKEC